MLDKKQFLINNLKCSHKLTDLYKICQTCNLRILNNILCFENYDDSEIEKNDKKNKTSFSAWKKFNFQKVNNVLNTKKNLNILDIGSGKHFIEKIFPELKENNFFRLDLANREYVDIIADLQKDSYFQKCFDVVICLNVLEHVYKFEDFVNNMSNLVKKDGILLLSVPYNSGLHYLPNDYFRMSHYALKRLLEEKNFKIESIEPFYSSFIKKIITNFENFSINKNFFTKAMVSIIVFQIKCLNKITNSELCRKLIDDVEKKNQKLYKEPVGFFVKANKIN
jgi:SAM-dependent methyltransferase